MILIFLSIKEWCVSSVCLPNLEICLFIMWLYHGCFSISNVSLLLLMSVNWSYHVTLDIFVFLTLVCYFWCLSILNICLLLMYVYLWRLHTPCVWLLLRSAYSYCLSIPDVCLLLKSVHPLCLPTSHLYLPWSLFTRDVCLFLMRVYPWCLPTPDVCLITVVYHGRHSVLNVCLLQASAYS